MSNREKQLIGVVAVLLVLVALYFAAYKPMLNKRIALEEEIDSLTVTATELRKEYEQLPVYKEGILAAQKNIKAIEGNYPAGLSQEAAFKLIFDIEEDFETMQFEDVTFSGKEVLSYSDENNDENTLFATKQTMTSNFVMTYDTLKEFLAFIRDYPNRTVLSDINLNLIEDKKEIGFTLSANSYAIEGGGRAYTKPTFSEVPLGKDQLFDTPRVEDLPDILLDDQPRDPKSDFFISLSPVQADIAAQIIGLSTDNNQSTYVENDLNDVVQAIIRIYEENGDYFVNYDVGGSYRSGIPFDLGDALELDLYSTARVDENDAVGMTLTVFNETDYILYINMKEEDEDQPRFRVNVSEGKVKMK